MKINKNNIFTGNLFSEVAENRLSWQHASTPRGGFGSAPEKGKFPQERESMDAVYKDLLDVAKNIILSNPDYADLIDDDEWRRYVFSVASYDFGRGGVRLLSDGEITAEDIVSTFGSEQKRLTLKKDAENSVQSYIDSTDKLKKLLESAIKRAKDKGYSTKRMKKASEVIENIAADRDVLGKRQGIVIDIADKLIMLAFEEKGLAEAKGKVSKIFNELTDEQKDLIDDVHGKKGTLLIKILEEMNKLPATSKFNKENLEGIFKVLREVSTLPPPEISVNRGNPDYDGDPEDIQDRVSIRMGLRDAQEQLVISDAEIRKHLIERFPERLRFYYLVNGGKASDLIEKCRREDGKIDTSFMISMLQALKEEDVDPKSAVALVGNLGLDNIVDDKLENISRKYSLDSDLTKEISKMILEKGKFAFTTNLLFAEEYRMTFRSNVETFKKFVSLVFGKEAEEDMVKNAPEEDVDRYAEYLAIYKPHLVMLDDAAEDFASVWDSSALENYLTNTVNYDGSPFVNAKKALDRAFLPESVNNFLDDKNINISTGDLHKLAKSKDINKFSSSDVEFADISDLLSRAIDVVIDEKTGKFNKEKAVNIFAFLLRKKEDKKGDAVITAEEIVEKIEASAKKSDGYFMMTGTEIYVKGSNLIERNARIKELKKNIGSILGLAPDAQKIEAHVASHLKELQDSKLNDESVGILEKIGLSSEEFGALIEKGAGSWWGRITSIGRNFESDNALSDLSNSNKGVREYEKIMKGLLNDFDKHDQGSEVSFKQMLLLHETEAEAIKRGTEFISLPENSKKLRDAMRIFLKKHAAIKQRLDPLLVGKSSLVRQRAFFLASQPKTSTNPDPMLRAISYINNPSAVTFDPADTAGFNVFVANMKSFESLEGKDILSRMKNELHVGMFEKSLDILHSRADKKGIGLLSGRYHFDNWMHDPEGAEQGLRAILYNTDEKIVIKGGASGGGKEALIRAFCNNETITLDNGRKITHSVAETYVLAIQSHLLRVQEDAFLSKVQVARKERFRDPLDVLRASGDAIVKLWDSGDRVKQGLAAAIVFSAGAVVWKGLKSSKWRKWVLGVPLFFGADYVVKDMTGKGILQRLKLTYMNEKDRNSATEQFIRRNEKRKGFEDIGTTAGYEAVRQLMDAENPVPVSDLLDWRANARAAGFNGKFSEGAPDQVRAVVGKISSKLGSLEKQSYSRDEEEERGYEIMLKAFEALCIDVAAGDPDVPDTIQDGEALIRRRYVNFSEAYLNSVKGLPQLLQDVASKRPGGGFSMLDVLVYERPTPAANAEIFQNETMAEWMFRKAGISVDWAKSMFKKGYAPMEIYAKHLKERTPAIYRSGKEVFIDGYDSLVEHLTPIYKKVGMEISEEWDAAMKMFFNAVSAAGIVLSKTPDGIEFALREGKELSVGAVRSIYLELARHHVTGPVLNLFERFVRRVFKGEILDLITLLETVETDNEHVEALADLENMKSNLVKHLNSVIEIEESLGGDDVDEWVVDAYEELSGESLAGANTAAQINAFSKVQAYEKMAVYELVKRRAYSFVIAKYLEEKNRVGKDKIKFPIKVRDSWPEGLSIMGGNAENIDSIYGWNVLRFIDIENSMSGAIEKSIEGMDPGVKRGFCEIATIPVNRAMHENAHDYIARSRKWFRDTFMRNAEEVFDGLPEDEKQEKLRHYKAYLDTLMTNVAIEITLGKINGDFVDVHDEGNIMELSISRAQDYLLYLKYYRGSSMNPMKISDLKLNSFAPESDKNALSELKKIAGDPEDSDSSIEEKTMPLSDAEKEKTTNIVNKIKDGKLKKLTPEEKRLLLGGIATGDVGVGTVKDKFNDNVEKLENMGSSEVRKDCLVHLCIVSPEKRSEIHEKLLGYFDKPTDEKINDLVDLSVFKEKIPAEFHDQIQIALDRAAVKMFKEVCREIGEVENMTKFDDMAKEKTNDAGGKRFKKWKEYIVKLYSVADETDPYFGKTSHLISYALEFLLYKGGDATYEQYKKDLNTLGREMRVRDLNPLPANAYAVYDPPGWFDGKTWPKLIDRLSVDSRGMALDPKVHMNPPIVVANKLEEELEDKVDK